MSARHDTGTVKIGAVPAQAAGVPTDAHGLVDVLPVAAVPAHPVNQPQSVAAVLQGYVGDLLAVTCPYAAAAITSTQAAVAVEPVHIERSAFFDRTAAPVDASARTHAAHHNVALHFTEIVWQLSPSARADVRCGWIWW